MFTTTYSVHNVNLTDSRESDLFCVGAMYSGEYDACDVTLSVYPGLVFQRS